tara:strand:- start:2038 stop:2364 length:327 start_codon:yes stop_codon:yes gene_type:complete
MVLRETHGVNMLATLRTLGIGAWLACILTLVYQGLSWALNASWPSLTLMSVSNNLLGFDLLSILQNLPVDLAVKTIYILSTTELSIALWWLGVFFFGTALGWKVVFGK